MAEGAGEENETQAMLSMAPPANLSKCLPGAPRGPRSFSAPVTKYRIIEIWRGLKQPGLTVSRSEQTATVTGWPRIFSHPQQKRPHRLPRADRLTSFLMCKATTPPQRFIHSLTQQIRVEGLFPKSHWSSVWETQGGKKKKNYKSPSLMEIIFQLIKKKIEKKKQWA